MQMGAWFLQVFLPGQIWIELLAFWELKKDFLRISCMMGKKAWVPGVVLVRIF
jgi:hypothetical protein